MLDGTQPRTASAGQDPDDTISPKGQFSQDINFASCTGQLPNPPLTAQQLTNLQNALTGMPSAGFGGQCAGVDHGDRIARDYVMSWWRPFRTSTISTDIAHPTVV